MRIVKQILNPYFCGSANMGMKVILYLTDINAVEYMLKEKPQLECINAIPLFLPINNDISQLIYTVN